MNAQDYIGLGTLVIMGLGLFGGLASWLIGKYERVQQSLQETEKAQVLAAIENLSKAQDKITERIVHWENVQSAQIHSSMKQFAVLESAVRDYSKDVTSLNQRCQDLSRESENQFKIMSAEIQRVWKTFVEEIAPGVFRVSDKKK
jgi:uncharacterized protein YoxC